MLASQNLILIDLWYAVTYPAALSQAASEGETLERYGEWQEASACRKAGDVRSAL